MRIATFNANSIRLRASAILDWIAENEPDVFCVQETKCEDSKFPRFDFEEAGLNVVFHGQKSNNGVAIISPHPILDVRTGMGDPLFPEDSRILAATVEGFQIVNTYVPNGTAVATDKFTYKLNWLERFARLLIERYSGSSNVVWLGDINIAPGPLDVYDSSRKLGVVGHHPEEFKRLDAIKNLGFVDLFRQFHPEGGQYTYWDYFIPNALERNLGWRIDHIYADRDLASRCIACEIDRSLRALERPSDHTVIYADFD